MGQTDYRARKPRRTTVLHPGEQELELLEAGPVARFVLTEYALRPSYTLSTEATRARAERGRPSPGRPHSHPPSYRAGMKSPSPRS